MALRSLSKRSRASRMILLTAVRSPMARRSASQPPVHRHPGAALARRLQVVCQTAPRVTLQSIPPLDQPRPNRIEVDVGDKPGEILPLLHRLGLVAPAKEMAPETVPGIKPPRPGILKPTHPLYEVWLGSLEEKVVVVAHEHPSVEHPPAGLHNLLETLDKTPPVPVVQDDLAPPVPPRHGVIDGTRILDPALPRHVATVLGRRLMSIRFA